MKNKYLAALIIVVILGLVGCRNESKTGIPKQSNESEGDHLTNEMYENDSSAESEKNDDDNNSDDSQETASGTKRILKGVYVVGEYIKPGTYILTNNSDTSYLSIVMFSNEDNYNSYKESDRSTRGEESEAREKNAWYDVSLNIGETVYMNLEAGSVLVVDDAEVEMSEVDISEMVSNKESSPFDKALLVIGKDIPEGQYEIECTEAKISSIKIVLFENPDSFLKYHKTRRFTNGEEQDAIDANSKLCDWIYKDDFFSIYLYEGNILVMDGGNVKISILE